MLAARDAVSDLRADEVSMIEGTIAALTEALRKFEPAGRGNKLIKGRVLVILLPSPGNAKLRAMYFEGYTQV